MPVEIDADLVRTAYAFILGREPENEEVVQKHLAAGSIEKLRSALLGSEEFKAKAIGWLFPKSKWVCTEVLERFTIWVDLHDRHVSRACLSGIWEPEETAFFMSRLRPGDTVLDIGANVGWYSLVAATKVGQHGRVHAFEPRPETAQMLKRTIAENGLRSVVHVWEYALADKPDLLRLAWGENTDNPGGSFLVNPDSTPGDKGNVFADVIALRLDDLLPEVEPDIVKIDIEGAEPRALYGARKALSKRHPLILSELHPRQLARVSGHSCSQYINQMAELGYACYMFEKGRPTRRLADFPADSGRDLVTVVFEWRSDVLLTQ